MSAITSASQGDAHDHQLNETLIESTNESQETMLLQKIQASSAGMEALLQQVVECQVQNQQQMMEMLRILANNGSTSISINTGISNDGVTKSSVDVNPNKQNTNNLTQHEDGEDDKREVDKDVIREEPDSENRQQQEEPRRYRTLYEGYEPLYEAIERCDWGRATEYLSDNQTTLKEIFETTDCGEEIYRILRRLIFSDPMRLLEKFLEVVPPKALEYQATVPLLNFAARMENLRAVKALVKKNRNLTQIRANGSVPLVSAVLFVTKKGQTETEAVEIAEYLCSVTRDEDPSPFSGKEGPLIIIHLIDANMYDTALSICQRCPKLLNGWITQEGFDNISDLFKLMVRRLFMFRAGLKLAWWERCIYLALGEEREDISMYDGGTIADEENLLETSVREKSLNYIMRHIRRVPFVKRLRHNKLMHACALALVTDLFAQAYKTMEEETIRDLFFKSGTLEMAIDFGTTEFVSKFLRVFDGFILQEEVVTLVIRGRNELVYNFFHRMEQWDRRIQAFRRVEYGLRDENGVSILHISAEVAHNRRLNVVSGAAFQMQREIQWFKAVENTMQEKDRFMTNNKGETAQFLFTENHKDLMEKAEKWMKELSTSCMVVAALIATIAFAAAITVPGGNISDKENRENGLPVFLHRKSFMLFAISDALALFSSITSVLMFLTLFTSRYSEEDFIKSLPQKIIIGLFTLFISMATMLVAFGAVFTIVVGRQSLWAPVAVSLLGCAPILLFGFMQFPLFFEMVHSTYWPITLGEEQEEED